MATLMHEETRAIPGLLREQIARFGAEYQKAAERLLMLAPPVIVTMARGSSDHAALFFKYLCELETGTPVASVGPSVASVYDRPLHLAGAACLAVSQSGRSPDLLAFQKMAGEAGALNLALVNVPDSPLAAAADCVLPVGSGEERAVAATKSFVLSLTAMAGLVGAMAGQSEMTLALPKLPECLETALECDWSPLGDALAPGSSLYVIGRGPGLAIAHEAALKFKETCQLHAESYSSAEVLHGPIQLAASGLTALVFLARDASRAGTIEAIERLAASGAKIFVADPAGEQPVGSAAVTYLPCAAAPLPLLDPIVQVTSFYVFIEQMAGRLGLDPDRPALLRKVTETL